LKSKQTLILGAAGVAITVLTLVGCTSKSGTAETSGAGSSGAVASSQSSTASQSSPGSTSPGSGPSTMTPGTHSVEFADGTKVAGPMSCSYGNKHLRLVLTGFADGSNVTIDFDPVMGSQFDSGDYVLRSKTNGNKIASGPVNISSSVSDTTAAAGGAQSLYFSFRANYTDAKTGESGSVSGQGACVIDGDRLGS
jgi:hypothetical protein